jgi:hypothetical protein
VSVVYSGLPLVSLGLPLEFPLTCQNNHKEIDMCILTAKGYLLQEG